MSITEWVETHVVDGKISIEPMMSDGVIFMYESDFKELQEELQSMHEFNAGESI